MKLQRSCTRTGLLTFQSGQGGVGLLTPSAGWAESGALEVGAAEIPTLNKTSSGN